MIVSIIQHPAEVINPVELLWGGRLDSHVKYGDIITAYCNLGSVEIPVGYSYVSGMGELIVTGAVNKGVLVFCKNYYERNIQLPMGIAEFLIGNGVGPRMQRFKFPTTPAILAGGWDRKWVTGPAGYLDRDWYVHGTRVHRTSPDDSPDVILRAPIRNRIDAQAVAFAIEFELCKCGKLFNQEQSTDDPFINLGSLITNASAKILELDGYPPNLAELWRRQKELDHDLNPFIEAYVRLGCA